MARSRKHIDDRTAISRFLSHLARDTDKGSARDNLISIINDATLEAVNHHCLFTPLLKRQPTKIQNEFNTVCFTETPLNCLQLLMDIPDRDIKLKPYGLVFKKADLVRNYKANPVFYVYNDALEDYYKDEYRKYISRRKQGMKKPQDFPMIGALINKVGGNYDFHWEREWRVLGDIEFNIMGIFAVIAPRNEHKRIKRNINDSSINKIPFIDITWSNEKILEQVSEQMSNL